LVTYVIGMDRDYFMKIRIGSYESYCQLLNFSMHLNNLSLLFDFLLDWNHDLIIKCKFSKVIYSWNCFVLSLLCNHFSICFELQSKCNNFPKQIALWPESRTYQGGDKLYFFIFIIKKKSFWSTKKVYFKIVLKKKENPIRFGCFEHTDTSALGARLTFWNGKFREGTYLRVLAGRYLRGTRFTFA
jgi:hypothetical protein